jgi:hypothetical protein
VDSPENKPFAKSRADFGGVPVDPEALRAAWPWTQAFSRQLADMRPAPFAGSHLMFGSDYSGTHSKSQFQIYGFVITDADSSPEWPARCRGVRNAYLKGRRMSFKNLNDSHRQQALVPFLEAAETLHGHVVVVAVAKELTYLCTHSRAIETWSGLHTLHAGWNRRAFEQMARVAHFFSLFLAAWSSPGMHISWMTDEDDIVANPGRLEDAHQFAARLAGLYVKHPLGEFMMNTPAVVGNDTAFEDYLAIPDLASGMVGEVLAVNRPHWSDGNSLPEGHHLSRKSDIIADWFWHNDGSLKKSCILIQRAGKGQFGIGTLGMQS